jgi:aquaporin Z
LAYAFFELLGGCLAAVLFACVRPEDFGGQSQPNRSFAVCEFIGTFMLVLTVGLNVLGKSKAGAISIAAALMSMVYAVGDISGAHFNPAVTLAVFLSGRLPDFTWRQACRYVAAQLSGSLAAGLTYLVVYVGASFPIGPVNGSTWGQVAIGEFIFTFLLCYVVLCVAVSVRTKSTHMFGFAIGACVIVAGGAIGRISGGSLNPAVSVGVAAANTANGGLLYKGLLYSAVEIAGGAAAAGVFSVTHRSDMELNQMQVRLF